MPTPLTDEQCAANLYRWPRSEHLLPAYALGWFLGGLLFWAARLRLRTGGEAAAQGWAGRVFAARAEALERTGTTYHRSDFVRFHHHQLMLFQLVYLAVATLTCGVGLLIGAPYYLWVLGRGRRAAEAGEWSRLPVVGSWVRGPTRPAG